MTNIVINCSSVLQNHWSALHLAAWNGYNKLCDVLLTVPSLDVDLPGPGDSTALSLACQQGHLDIIHRLLDAKCDVNRTATLGDSHGVTALHLAAQNGHAEVVKLLLCAGAVVNACMTVKDIQGVTPLHVAVESDKLEVMDLLIEAGCNIHSSTQPCQDTSCWESRHVVATECYGFSTQLQLIDYQYHRLDHFKGVSRGDDWCVTLKWAAICKGPLLAGMVVVFCKIPGSTTRKHYQEALPGSTTRKHYQEALPGWPPFALLPIHPPGMNIPQFGSMDNHHWGINLVYNYSKSILRVSVLMLLL